MTFRVKRSEKRHARPIARDGGGGRGWLGVVPVLRSRSPTAGSFCERDGASSSPARSASLVLARKGTINGECTASGDHRVVLSRTRFQRPLPFQTQETARGALGIEARMPPLRIKLGGELGGRCRWPSTGRLKPKRPPAAHRAATLEGGVARERNKRGGVG